MCFALHLFFFFNDTATTEIYTLSLHDALPISTKSSGASCPRDERPYRAPAVRGGYVASLGGRYHDRDPGPRHGRSRRTQRARRSEEHTSELQSRQYLVCRLLLEKKKQNNILSN